MSKARAMSVQNPIWLQFELKRKHTTMDTMHRTVGEMEIMENESLYIHDDQGAREHEHEREHESTGMSTEHGARTRVLRYCDGEVMMHERV